MLKHERCKKTLKSRSVEEQWMLKHESYTTYGMRQKTLPLPFNGTERVVPFPFNNISLSIHNPFVIRSRSVRIFRPF